MKYQAYEFHVMNKVFHIVTLHINESLPHITCKKYVVTLNINGNIVLNNNSVKAFMQQ